MLARPKVRPRGVMARFHLSAARGGAHPAHLVVARAFARAAPPRRLPPDPSIPRAPTTRQCRVLAVIPARFDSERFPGKPLARVGGKSLVRLTYEAAESAKCVDHCCVATDDDRVIDAVKSFNGRIVRTPRDCADGFERCAHAYRLLVAGRARRVGRATSARPTSTSSSRWSATRRSSARITSRRWRISSSTRTPSSPPSCASAEDRRCVEARRRGGRRHLGFRAPSAERTPRGFEIRRGRCHDRSVRRGRFCVDALPWSLFFSLPTDESRPSSSSQDDENPDTVKCAMDADGYVTGFTRGAPPPGGMVKVGVTAYRSSFLTRENRTRGGRKANARRRGRLNEPRWWTRTRRWRRGTESWRSR